MDRGQYEASMVLADASVPRYWLVIMPMRRMGDEWRWTQGSMIADGDRYELAALLALGGPTAQRRPLSKLSVVASLNNRPAAPRPPPHHRLTTNSPPPPRTPHQSHVTDPAAAENASAASDSAAGPAMARRRGSETQPDRRAVSAHPSRPGRTTSPAAEIRTAASHPATAGTGAGTAAAADAATAATAAAAAANSYKPGRTKSTGRGAGEVAARPGAEA